MMTIEKNLVDMRIARLQAEAEAARLARPGRDTSERMPRWSIIRLIRHDRPVAAA